MKPIVDTKKIVNYIRFWQTVKPFFLDKNRVKKQNYTY